MIPETKLKLILQRERVYWMQRAQSEFVMGIVYGLKLATKAIDRVPAFRVSPRFYDGLKQINKQENK